MDGTIREGFLWNPTDAGYAMVAVAKLVLDGTRDRGRRRDPRPRQGGRSTSTNKQIKVDKIMQINKDTVDGLIAQGL